MSEAIHGIRGQLFISEDGGVNFDKLIAEVGNITFNIATARVSARNRNTGISPTTGVLWDETIADANSWNVEFDMNYLNQDVQQGFLHDASIEQTEFYVRVVGDEGVDNDQFEGKIGISNDSFSLPISDKALCRISAVGTGELVRSAQTE